MARKTVIGIGIATAACAGALLVPANAFAAGDRHGPTSWNALTAAGAPAAPGTGGTPVVTGGTGASPQPVTSVATTTVATVGTRAVAGQSMTIRAQVRVGRSHPHGIKAETGTVTFTVDGTSGKPVTIKRGRASEQVTLAAGKHTVVASYSGDADHMSSSSAPVSFTLN